VTKQLKNEILLFEFHFPIVSETRSVWKFWNLHEAKSKSFAAEALYSFLTWPYAQIVVGCCARRDDEISRMKTRKYSIRRTIRCSLVNDLFDIGNAVLCSMFNREYNSRQSPNNEPATEESSYGVWIAGGYKAALTPEQ